MGCVGRLVPELTQGGRTSRHTQSQIGPERNERIRKRVPPAIRTILMCEDQAHDKGVPWNDFRVTRAQIIEEIIMATWVRRTWGTFTGRVGRSGRADPLRFPAWLHRSS